MQRLAEAAVAKGQNNIAFAAYLQLGDSASCINLLASTDRLPEAALMARSYNPSMSSGVVKKWKGELQAAGRAKVAAVIGSPDADRDLFPEVDDEGSGVLVENVDALADGVGALSVGKGSVPPSPKKGSRSPSPVEASRSPSPVKAASPPPTSPVKAAIDSAAGSPKPAVSPSPTPGSPKKATSPTPGGKADKKD